MEMENESNIGGEKIALALVKARLIGVMQARAEGARER